MILDLVMQQYWTDEDETRTNALADEQSEIVRQIEEQRESNNTLYGNPALMDQYHRLEDEINEIYREAEQRYINARTKKQILEDAQQIAQAYTKEDFLQNIDRHRKSLNEALKKEHDFQNPVEIELLTEWSKENYENCAFLIRTYLRVQYNALANDKKATDKLNDIVNSRVALWYATQTEPQNIKFLYPETFTQALTKASATIFDSKKTIDELRQISLDVSPKKSTRTYAVNIDMSAPELKGTENITEYDRSVFDAVTSIIKSNPAGTFTSKQVAAHLLYGNNPYNSNPSPQRVGSVTKTIERLRHIDITIDYMDHLRLNRNTPAGLTAFTIKGYMLPVRECTAKINSQVVKAYQLLETPPLYKYAEDIGQIATHPAKMLNVPGNMNEEKIIIRDYLLREIAHLKNNKKWNDTISLQRLMNAAGIENASRKKRHTTVNAIREMLKYWKAEGDIQDYKEVLAGQTVRSFKITV